MVVPGKGIEPIPPCGERILSPPRLPISPPRRGDQLHPGVNVTTSPRRLINPTGFA